MDEEQSSSTLHARTTPGWPVIRPNPKPAGPGRERYRCLRQERIIKARDSAMLAT